MRNTDRAGGATWHQLVCIQQSLLDVRETIERSWVTIEESLRLLRKLAEQRETAWLKGRPLELE